MAIFRKWQPSYPDAARTPNKGSAVEFEVPEEFQELGDDLPWHDAPATSHIKRMKFQDADRISFLRKFGGGESVITIQFRVSGKSQSEPVYTYHYRDREEARKIWDQLTTSAHPYGEVFYPLIRQARVPYTKVSG